MNNPSTRVFRGTTLFWFVVFLLGQLIFAGYITILYWRSAVLGNYDKWNTTVPRMYIPGHFMHNALFGIHVAAAALISVAGPLQLIPQLRASVPRYHRIAGRIYVVAGMLIAFDGIFLVWRPGATGDVQDHIIISINALIIMLTGWCTIRHARAGNIHAHRQWAVHLVLAMSGVWLFRVYLMCWLVINQGPVGFDPDTFSGPFLDALSFAVYVFPQVVVWWYFRARDADGETAKNLFSTVLTLITLTMLVGVVAATMGMWLPRLR